MRTVARWFRGVTRIDVALEMSSIKLSYYYYNNCDIMVIKFISMSLSK